MIKKFRKRAILFTVLIMFLVLGTIIGVINIINYMTMIRKMDHTLISSIQHLKEKGSNGMGSHIGGINGGNRRIAERDLNKIREFITENRPNREHYNRLNIRQKKLLPKLVVVEYKNDEIKKIINLTNIGYSINDINKDNQILKIIRAGSKNGFSGSFRYLNVKSSNLIFLLESNVELQFFYSSVANSVVILIVGMIAVVVLVYIFSSFIIRPTVEAYDKQKKFVTDASHELKTPVAAIVSSLELLNCDIEENKWLNSAMMATTRLNVLLEEFLELSKLGEDKEKEKATLNMTSIVNEAIACYEPNFKKENKKISKKVSSKIAYEGVEKEIIKIVDVMVENASKYSKSNTSIEFVLEKKGNKILFKTINHCEGLKAGNYNHIFDRFARLDESRSSETGGHGIGLAIVAEIVQAHGGQFYAKSNGSQMEVGVEL